VDLDAALHNNQQNMAGLSKLYTSDAEVIMADGRDDGTAAGMIAALASQLGAITTG
jgi:hypothetical protein